MDIIMYMELKCGLSPWCNDEIQCYCEHSSEYHQVLVSNVALVPSSAGATTMTWSSLLLMVVVLWP